MEQPGAPQATVASGFGVHRSTVRRLLKNKESLLEEHSLTLNLTENEKEKGKYGYRRRSAPLVPTKLAQGSRVTG